MNVDITLHTVQVLDGETEETRLTARGTLERREDGVQFSYTEPEGAKVTVAVRPSTTVIERHGEVHSQMLLEVGKRHLCRYETPYGRLMLHTQTEQLTFSFENGTGYLRAAYTLDMNGATTAHQIEITIKEVSPC